jgi:hypothetical protein
MRTFDQADNFTTIDSRYVATMSGDQGQKGLGGRFHVTTWQVEWDVLLLIYIFYWLYKMRNCSYCIARIAAHNL